MQKEEKRSEIRKAENNDHSRICCNVTQKNGHIWI